MRILLFFALGALGACGAETQADSYPETQIGTDFSVVLKPSGEPGKCRPETVTTISGAVPIYMVRGEKMMDHKNGGQKTSFPLQMQFRGYGPETVKKDTAVSVSNYDIACADMVITWKIDSCMDETRANMACPDFNVSGEDAFAGFVIER